MNEHDTTMMIAAHIAAQLAATEKPYDIIPWADEDFTMDEKKGVYYKDDQYGSYHTCPVLGGSERQCEHKHLAFTATLDQRIARYSARLAAQVGKAVQRELESSLQNPFPPPPYRKQ